MDEMSRRICQKMDLFYAGLRSRGVDQAHVFLYFIKDGRGHTVLLPWQYIDKILSCDENIAAQLVEMGLARGVMSLPVQGS